MPHGELDVPPVEHGHQPLFEIVLRADRGALAEDRLAIDAADDELGLEDVVLVLGPQFLLGVDEKQRDDGMCIPLANLPPNVNVGELGIGSLQLVRPVLERNRDAPASGVPLPDQ